MQEIQEKCDMIKKISIVIPVHNEEKSIQIVIEALKQTLSHYCEYEIIVVNDGSTDNTQAVLDKVDNIKVINKASSCGYGAAIKTGVKEVKNDHFVIIDGDNTYPVKEILSMFKYTEYDMVVGARIGANTKIPLVRKPAKWAINQLANFLTNTKIPDLNSGLRLIKKDLFSSFEYIFPNGFSLTTTITLASLTNGYKIKYIPIDYHSRMGKSKIRPIKDTLNFIQLIFRTVLYFNPLKVFGLMSFILFCASLFILFWSYLFTPNMMDTTGIVLMIAAIQILATGMLADLIVKSTKRYRTK